MNKKQSKKIKWNAIYLFIIGIIFISANYSTKLIDTLYAIYGSHPSDSVDFRTIGSAFIILSIILFIRAANQKKKEDGGKEDKKEQSLEEMLLSESSEETR